MVFFLSKLFWPIVRKNCSSDQEFFLKFEAEGKIQTGLNCAYDGLSEVILTLSHSRNKQEKWEKSFVT